MIIFWNKKMFEDAVLEIIATNLKINGNVRHIPNPYGNTYKVLTDVGLKIAGEDYYFSSVLERNMETPL